MPETDATTPTILKCQILNFFRQSCLLLTFFLVYYCKFVLFLFIVAKIRSTDKRCFLADLIPVLLSHHGRNNK